MPTPIDPTRLPRLKAALKRYKAGETIAQQDLAAVYGVTNARFTTLAHSRFEGMPKPERRGDKTHWYEARPAIEAMIRYCEGTGKRKSAAAARARTVIKEAEEEAGQEQPTGVVVEMTPAEMDKLASAQTRIFRLSQEKKQFVRVEQHQHLVRRIFATVQRAISSFPTEADPNGELPPMVRARLDSAARDALKRLHKEVSEDLLLDAEEDSRAA